MDITLGTPAHIEYHYDIVDGPLVPTWDGERTGRQMRVSSVNVTYYPSTDVIEASVHGSVVRADGSRDGRFTTLETADLPTERAYAVAWAHTPDAARASS